MPCTLGNQEHVAYPSTEHPGQYEMENSEFRFSIHYSADGLGQLKEAENNFFFDNKYYGILDRFPSGNTCQIYLNVYQGNSTIGRLWCQLMDVKGERILKIREEGNAVKRFFKKSFLKLIRAKALVCGNLLLSGDFGVSLDIQDKSRKVDLTRRVISAAIPFIQKDKGVHICMKFFKDYPEELEEHYQQLEEFNFVKFSAEPVMVMDVPEEWNSFDDYLAAMTSKYRVRAKRAFKKGKDIERVNFTHDRILAHKERLHELYCMVKDSVDFNLVSLNIEYFAELKRVFPEEFDLVGYFLEGKLIAFFTVMNRGGEAHAHFLGLDASYNRDYQAYLNILYDIIRLSIDKKAHHIDFARTALEIKSSVGATPYPMFFYLQHRAPFASGIMRWVYNSFSPVEEVVYRQPFKNQTKGSKQTEHADASRPSGS